MSVTVQGRRCEWCGSLFAASRADARYCSTRCRVAAHRSAKSGKPKPKPTRSMTNTEVMAHLEELLALSRKWSPDALDALGGKDAKRQVMIAEQVARWIDKEFVPAHAAQVTKLAKVPT